MGQATRTTKLPLDLGKRTQGGANTSKQAYLEATVGVLSAARAFYVAFFLAHAEKVTERVPYFSEQHQEMRERLIPADKLLTWAEFQTVETKEHPHPVPEWNFSQAFAGMPFVYRRAVIKDAIGKVRSYLSNLSTWQQSGKRKGNPVDDRPCPYADEHTRPKVVGLALVRKGEVPAHVTSRTPPGSITFQNMAGTLESRTESGRRTHSVQDCLQFWTAVDTTYA